MPLRRGLVRVGVWKDPDGQYECNWVALVFYYECNWVALVFYYAPETAKEALREESRHTRGDGSDQHHAGRADLV